MTLQNGNKKMFKMAEQMKEERKDVIGVRYVRMNMVILKWKRLT